MSKARSLADFIEADGSATIDGLTVGQGAGNVSTNTAVGASALAANTSGIQNTGLGANALQYQTNNNNTALGYNAMVGVNGSSSGGSNTAVGSNSLAGLTVGNFNTAIGQQALQANTTAEGNTAVGYQAGYTNTTGTYNTYFGWHAGYVATGSGNSYLGTTAGYAMTTGSNNTIIGAYGGNQGGLDIRTSSNYIVLSDGDGNPRAYCNSSGTFLFPKPQGVGGMYQYGNGGYHSVASGDNTDFLLCTNFSGAMTIWVEAFWGWNNGSNQTSVIMTCGQKYDNSVLWTNTVASAGTGATFSFYKSGTNLYFRIAATINNNGDHILYVRSNQNIVLNGF
jgi:hypothetical protein